MSHSGQGPSPRVVEGWVSLRDAIADGQRRLAAAGVPSPDTDAMLLAAHVKGVPRGRLLLHDRMDPTERTAYERLLTKRVARVPLQHLVGSAAFATAWLLLPGGRAEAAEMFGELRSALRPATAAAH